MENLANDLQNHFRALRMLSVRLVAMERTIQHLDPALYRYYWEQVRELESQKRPAAPPSDMPTDDELYRFLNHKPD